MKTLEDCVHVIAEHSARTLPDSICERKKVLRALQRVMAENHPAMAKVRAQLAAIQAIEKLNEELPLCFNPEVAS